MRIISSGRRTDAVDPESVLRYNEHRPGALVQCELLAACQ